MSLQQLQDYLISVPRMETKFYYGDTGGGKSIHAVFDACKHHYLLGRRTIANFHIDLPNHVYIEPIDIIISLDPKRAHEGKYAHILNDTTPKTLILDEIGKWWNNRNHESMTNKLLGYFVDQCRKRNIKLIVIDQHVSGFDIKGRDHVQDLVKCYAEYIPDTDIPWFFHYINYNRKNGKVRAYKLPAQYMIRIFGRLYDSTEHTTPIEMVMDNTIIDELLAIQKDNTSRDAIIGNDMIRNDNIIGNNNHQII